jgi:hypothetical protein
MHLDILIDHLLASIAQERMLLRRLSRFVLPLLLLPIGFALAQMAHSWLGLAAGGLGGAMLLAQIELFLRPTLSRARAIDHDMRFYLGRSPDDQAPDRLPVVPLLLPSAVALVASMALFLPTILVSAPAWQRLLALALGGGALWSIGQRLSQIVVLIGRIESHLAVVRTQLLATDHGEQRTTEHRPPTTGQDGLLDPALSRIVAGLPLPPLPLSPAARALLRVEAYLLLRDFSVAGDRALLDALTGLAREAYEDELRHWLLPPVGGKLYLPITANGALASLLGATARRLGMDSGYSASLGTWLIRLPPARSYAVAGRLTGWSRYGSRRPARCCPIT